MDSYLNALPNVNQFNFAGAVVLSPARDQSSAVPEGKPPKTDEEIEQSLIASYRKVGFEVWVQGDANTEGSITVMGLLTSAERPDIEEVVPDLQLVAVHFRPL